MLPTELVSKLREHGQEHVLAGWDKLSATEQQGLRDQLAGIDLDLLAKLHRQRDEVYQVPAADRIQPVPMLPAEPEDPRIRELGKRTLGRGEVAVLLVAGGQGSRLGFDPPKGMFPIGPVSNKTLFQIHAEKVLALQRRHGRAIPFLIMTSPATDADTKRFFAEQKYFGLPEEEVAFFCQGTLPAVDMATGQLLLEAPGKLFLSPNGHGGTLTALADSGLLARLAARGFRHIFYFQVDNPLVKVCDPAFLGYHVDARAQVSTKIVPKNSPTDKLGNLVLVDGKCGMIEYSDLPEELARQTDAEGKLRIRAGNTAIHVFDVEFLSHVIRTQGMPFHLARKKVPFLDAQGKVVQPTKENALKFEMFIFDVLTLAERWTVVETPRAEEFEPLKNASGPDSPETVRQAISNLAAAWLEKAGVKVPRRPDGNAAVPLEISPLYALDAEELARRVDRGLSVQGSRYLE